MRKVLVLTMAVLLAVTVFALAGCGNTAKAKEDMKKADAAWNAVNAKLTQLTNTLTTMVGAATSGNLSAVTQDQAALANIGTTLNTADTDIKGVEKLYTDLGDLNVAGYSDYADAMVKALGSTVGGIALGREIFAKLLPVIQTGDAAQITAFLQQNAALLTQAQTAQVKAQSDLQAAAKIKTDKKLGQ
jgi:hypothetical protein